MNDAVLALPKPPAARIAAWLLMLLGMWLALKLGLVVTLLSGLLVFQLTHVLANTVEGKLPPGRAAHAPSRSSCCRRSSSVRWCWPASAWPRSSATRPVARTCCWRG